MGFFNVNVNVCCGVQNKVASTDIHSAARFLRNTKTLMLMTPLNQRHNDDLKLKLLEKCPLVYFIHLNSLYLTELYLSFKSKRCLPLL